MGLGITVVSALWSLTMCFREDRGLLIRAMRLQRHKRSFGLNHGSGNDTARPENPLTAFQRGAKRTFGLSEKAGMGEVSHVVPRQQQSRRQQSKQLQQKERRVKNGDAPQYFHIQQVGASINTFPEDVQEGNLSSVYRGIDNAATLCSQQQGACLNNDADAQGRVEAMKDLMDIAYDSRYVVRRKDTLKIFMAPEFFFRGKYGAYNMMGLDNCVGSADTCSNAVLYILKGLRALVSQTKWLDWMFVFGTIVSYKLPRPGARMQYWNFAPVMFGGGAVSTHYIIAKSHISAIDFVACPTADAQLAQCVQNPMDVDLEKYSPFTSGNLAELQQLGFKLQNDSEFVYGAIRFGIEVCLDHAKGHLRKKLSGGLQDSLVTGYGLINAGLGVDVHLVVSAGMSIWTSAVYTGVNVNAQLGPVLLQDGSPEGAKTMYLCSTCSLRFDHLHKILGSPLDWLPASEMIPGVMSSPQASSDRKTDQPLQRPPTPIRVKPGKWKKWSPKTFGTEGSGEELDPRFAGIWDSGLFATDGCTPRINFSPKFLIPGVNAVAKDFRDSVFGRRSGRKVPQVGEGL